MIRMVPPHPSSLLQQAHALRHAGSLCDVVFSLEGRAFRAHRLVLAWSSPALAPRLLQEALDRPLRCTLDICSPHTFQQVLDYSYGQILALSPGELGPLRSAAGLLGMRHLEEQCRELQESLDPRAMDLTPPAPEDMEEWRAEVPAPRRLSPGKETKEEDEEEEVEMSRPPASPPPPSERSPSEKRVLASSTLPYTRDSVIRASSPRPPWASVSPLHPLTLRCVAQQYSSLVALRSLHHSQGHYHGPPAPRASSPGQADCAQAQPRRLSAAPPGLEDQVGPDLRARFSVTHSSEMRYMRRILHAPHVLVDRQRSEKCSPSSGHAHSRSEPSAGGGGRRLSPGVKPYACLQCPKRFSLKHQLETHHRVHTGEKPFECRLCGQRSRDYSAMIKHLRTHGGAGPYRCTACRDFCSSLAAMQKHVEQHAARDFPPDWSIRRTYLYTSHV